MQVGQKVGPYIIQKALGCGAMGTVYRAVNTDTDEYVAIKSINAGLIGNEKTVGRFIHEGEILKKLRHENIVRLIATGRHKSTGTPFFVMEYVEGESLDHVLERRKRYTWEQVVELGVQLCAALQHAHEKGIIHRDLKPSNVMILRDGTVKLTDFGIAKDPSVTALTEAHSTLGTASYMSPEQCRGERNLTHKSDIYSLGVMFYELLTGKKPFVAESPIDMFMLHAEGKFERPSRLALEIPIWLDSLVCQMMEKKPEHRPLDAAMVGKVLGEVLEKVESQLSAGVDAVKARVVDRDKRKPTESPLDETDREAARTLRSAVTKRKIRKKRVKVYQKVWFQSILIAAFLAGSGWAVYTLTRPASAASMVEDIDRLYAAKNRDKTIEAIDRYLKVYGDKDTDLTKHVRELEKPLKVDRREAQLHKRFRGTTLKGSALGPEDDDDPEAYNTTYKAWQAENDGDTDAARQRWQELADKFAGDPNPARQMWNWLAVKKLRDLDQSLLQDKDLKERAEKDHKAGTDRKPDNDVERKVVQGLNLELDKKWASARDLWAKLKADLMPELESRPWVLLAARHERDAQDKANTPAPKPPDEPKTSGP